jgi:hypothetical protein
MRDQLNDRYLLNICFSLHPSNSTQDHPVMSTDQAPTAERLADKKMVEQVLAEQKLEPPVTPKLPIDAHLKSKKRQNYCDFLAFW